MIDVPYGFRCKGAMLRLVQNVCSCILEPQYFTVPDDAASQCVTIDLAQHHDECLKWLTKDVPEIDPEADLVSARAGRYPAWATGVFKDSDD